MGYVLVIPCLFISCYLVGTLVCDRLSIPVSAINAIGLGMFFCVALFEVLAAPFMALQWRFTGLYWSYLVIMSGFILLSLIRLPNVRRKGSLSGIKPQSRKSLILILIIAALVLLQILAYVLLRHSDQDDSFYIAITNTVLDTDRVFGWDPSLGWETFPYPKAYRMIGYELLLAVIVKFFHVHAAILCHTLLPVFFVSLYYMMVYKLSKELFPKKTWEFVLCVCLLNVFGGYSAYSTASFLLLRIWQGKAVVANLVLPTIFLVFVKILKDKRINKARLAVLTLVLFAGVFFSSIGVYLPILAYGTLVLTYMLFHKKDWLRNVFRFSIPVACILPILISAFVMFSASGMDSGEIAGVEHLDYLQIWKDAMGQSLIFVLYLASCLILSVLGKNYEKMVFLAFPSLLLATFLNPLLMNQVATRITGVPVYWRLLWIIPTYFTIAAGLLLVCVKVKRRWLCDLIYVAGTLLVILNGTFIYNRDNFSVRENWYKIDQDVVEIANHVKNNKERAVLFAETEFSSQVRVYTADVLLHWSRINSYDRLGMQKEYDMLNLLYRELFMEQTLEDETILEALRHLGIEYVVLRNEKNNAIVSNERWSKELTLKKYSLYKLRNTT